MEELTRVTLTVPPLWPQSEHWPPGSPLLLLPRCRVFTLIPTFIFCFLSLKFFYIHARLLFSGAMASACGFKLRRAWMKSASKSRSRSGRTLREQAVARGLGERRTTARHHSCSHRYCGLCLPDTAAAANARFLIQTFFVFCFFFTARLNEALRSYSYVIVSFRAHDVALFEFSELKSEHGFLWLAGT